MRLQLFDVIDDTIALLDRRRAYYQSCAIDLQNLIKDILHGDALLGVHVRVKSEKSFREKILRKKLYLQYDTNYDLLNNLSDLIGVRAECRFMREEKLLYTLLCEACTQPHSDGMYSIPGHQNIRFLLSARQPQGQRNGLAIYRIDGIYHKNGVSAPFELQIKSLVHVFWAEIEHELIYKNNSYVPMNEFIKKLLYANYDSLRQIDGNLQLIYDHLYASQLAGEEYLNIQPVVAKALSDAFALRMRNQMGYSLRLSSACDTLARYLAGRFHKTRQAGDAVNEMLSHVRRAAMEDIVFDEMIELGGAYHSDNPFRNAVGCGLSRQFNLNYDINLFFRMLFALEQGNNIDAYSNFIGLYCARFEDETLYGAYPEETRESGRDAILARLSDVLCAYGDIAILYEDAIRNIQTAIRELCAKGCRDHETIRRRLESAVLFQE
ncbi:MAG: hypothetical protein LBS18_00095 [Clostridiales bacterium]|jgi:ppGpp synthetase/RelA/SpoT-type nucleotidyltranferase|nr:hypothetical protein [Clostridiales bacterium]